MILKTQKFLKNNKSIIKIFPKDNAMEIYRQYVA